MTGNGPSSATGAHRVVLVFPYSIHTAVSAVRPVASILLNAHCICLSFNVCCASCHSAYPQTDGHSQAKLTRTLDFNTKRKCH